MFVWLVAKIVNRVGVNIRVTHALCCAGTNGALDVLSFSGVRLPHDATS